MRTLIIGAVTLDLWQIILIAAIAVWVITMAAFIIAFRMSKLKRKNREAEERNKDEITTQVIDGVRYGNALGDVDVTHREGDTTLERGKEYVASKNGTLLPGKYTVLSANGDAAVFNVRVGGFVREMSHRSGIVLAEGDKICPVSHTIVLR